MSGWAYHNPVRLHFGSGVFDALADAIGGRTFILVTHPDAPLQPWRARLAELAGEPLLAIDNVEPNPSLAMLRRICTQVGAATHEPELIVALGGGSVMDTAKFLAAGRGRYAPVVQYMETGERLARRALPIVAIPTTSGTGSDLTKWATVWDPERKRKLSLNRDDLYAEAVFVDPRITESLPWPVTLASGLDALSHALESIWNRHATPVTRSFAVAAVRDIMAGLRRLHEDPRDGTAREKMALGATLAGLAFSNTQTALAHNISYPITLEHGVPHGIACSFCLPEVMIAAIGADAACDAALAELFDDLDQAPARLRHFLAGLGVAAGPETLGIGPDEWHEIVDAAFAGPRGRNFVGARSRFPLPTVAEA
ncbi:iron-containing alcohol dehydrogenase [Sphingomonas sp. QA11]|uniref:iron-containing alcohol dehydrogenase PsrA n=1 Tax=Sphingomonas sp. QA11 TaxID=2950605 RepID=UPI00234A9F46|nr:iron-containing alcohol dehydrogenase PsrA [Sphingomonas sp. QA11]WCM26290.1 iron-containing alcohol dehydrogenase [Sphingomonas sp. QA11]